MLYGRDVEEGGNVFDGGAISVRPGKLRVDGRFEHRNGHVLLAEDRLRLLAAALDVVCLDIRPVAADPLLVDLVEKLADEIHVVESEERVNRLSGDGLVGRAGHEQHRSGAFVGVPREPRRGRHLDVHARHVELPVDGERLRFLTGVPLGIRALRDLCRFSFEVEALAVAGTAGDRHGRRRGECREQPTSFHVRRYASSIV